MKQVIVDVRERSEFLKSIFQGPLIFRCPNSARWMRFSRYLKKNLFF
jgi:hypothetical protein